MQPSLTAVGTHMPCGITKGYAPPGRCDIPALNNNRCNDRRSQRGGKGKGKGIAVLDYRAWEGSGADPGS